MPPAVWTRRFSVLTCRADSQRTPVRRAVIIICAAFFIISPAPARASDGSGSLSTVTVPHGLRGALAAIEDPLTPDRGQFLVEFVRRFYTTPIGPRNDPRESAIRSLVQYLDAPGTPGEPTDTLPLPLTMTVWTDVVFDRRVTAHNLLSAIVQNRNASLLYHGLMSLDDQTRDWMAGERDLIVDISSRYAAGFVAAAPGLRIENGVLRLPGGEAAEPVWEALAGKRVRDPAEFIRALLTHSDGRLAFIVGAMSELTPNRVKLVLSLDAADAATRVDAGRRLLAVLDRVTPVWKADDRALSRASYDPALLAADLRIDASGRPILPGTRRFWSAVFGDGDIAGAKAKSDEAGPMVEGGPVDFAWLCEQVFKGDQIEQRRRYQVVLFASRNFTEITPATASDALEVIRAAGAYPALAATLERAGLTNLPAFAAAARRAAQLSTIADDTRVIRSLTQFQALLGLIARAAVKRTVSPEALAAMVSSLAAVEVNEKGDYDGALVRWLGDRVRDASKPLPNEGDLFADAAGPLERDILRLLSGPPASEPRIVEWEGTRYRLDFATAEATRLIRMLGEPPRPYLSSARKVLEIADAWNASPMKIDALKRTAADLARVEQDVAWEEWEASSARDRCRDTARNLQRAAHDGDAALAQTVSPSLRLLADDLFARGLMELTYASALGQPDRASISAIEAASRHDFGLRLPTGRRASPWRLPSPGATTARGWYVSGSLLGLDVALSDFSLVRLSLKPPTRRPTLNEDDRRTFSEAAVLVEPATLTDTDLQTIVSAISAGRARLAGVHTPQEALALSDEINLSPTRRSVLSWVIANDPDRIRTFLSPIELLWLGLGTRPVAPPLRAWGASAAPRVGCLCVELLDRRPWESLAGRWSSGIFATGFADLNLRLGELLQELHMPASLLAPVLASATLDFVNGARSRGQDDHRGLVEFVRALKSERVEQYLALLTTDGPLVPIAQSAPTTDGPGAQ